jgi:hypothetical protein
MTIGLRTTVAAAALAVALVAPALAAGGSAGESETLAGVCAFTKGDYPTARRHFERAAELEPAAAGPLVLAARAAYAEVFAAPEDARAEAARAALAAYERVLARDPNAEEAVTGLASLYLVAGDRAKALEVLRVRAARDGVAPQRRAELLSTAAMIEWRAAVDVMNANKAPGSRLPRFKRPPPDEAAALHARLDAARQLVDRALALGPNYTALIYKRMILDSVASLAELEGDAAGAVAARREAAEASQAANRSASGADSALEESWRAETERAAADVAGFARTGALRYDLDPYDAVPAARLASLLPPPPGASSSRESAWGVKEREAERRVANPWKEFSAEGEFTATMPSPVLSSPPGGDRRTFASVSEDVSFEVVAVTRTEGAGDELALRAAGEVAQGICDLARHEPARCEVAFARKLTIGGLPASQYHIAIVTPCGETRSGVIRVVFAGDRAYVLDVVGAGEDDPRAGRFLDSFTVSGH